MAIDRAGALRNAEKLVKQGRLDQAIAEYVRAVDESPDDWTTANTLGDLYAKNAQSDKAVECYGRIADSFFASGFLPKAAALYKKILKLKPDAEHALARAAEIAAGQGLLADARAHLGTLASLRKKRGDTAGAAEIAVRIASLDPNDYKARLAAARVTAERGDIGGAVEMFQAIAADLQDKGEIDASDEAFEEASRVDPGNASLLLSLIERHARAARSDAALAASGRLADLSPAHRGEIVTLGLVLAETAPDMGQALVAGSAERMAAEGDYAGAAAAFESWLARAPHDDAALVRLIEVAIDGDLAEVLTRAQLRLAELRMREGRPEQARFIAEDLVIRHPGHSEYRELLRRILQALGEAPQELAPAVAVPVKPVRAAASVAPPSEPAAAPARNERSDGRHGGAREADAAAPVTPSTPASGREMLRASGDEVDLSLLLDQILKPSDAPDTPADLDDVFAQMREQARRRLAIDSAEQDFRKAIALFQAGQIDESIPAFEAASRAPRFRFDSAALLGRIYLRRGDLSQAIGWLDRAAEAPARTPEDAHSVLYDLADALEATGDATRALAIYLQLQVDSEHYRDVAERIERLSGLRSRG